VRAFGVLANDFPYIEKAGFIELKPGIDIPPNAPR
jgi:hypothetical protein